MAGTALIQFRVKDWPNVMWDWIYAPDSASKKTFDLDSYHSWLPRRRTSMAFHPHTNAPIIRTWGLSIMSERIVKLDRKNMNWNNFPPFVLSLWNGLEHPELWDGSYVQFQAESGVAFDAHGNMYFTVDGETQGFGSVFKQALFAWSELEGKWRVYSAALPKLPYLRLEFYAGNNDSGYLPTVLGATTRSMDNTPSRFWPRKIYFVFCRRDGDGRLDNFERVEIPGAPTSTDSANPDHVVTIGDDTANVTAIWGNKIHVVWSYPGPKETDKVHVASNTYDRSHRKFMHDPSIHVGTVESGREVKQDPPGTPWPADCYEGDGIPWADVHCFPALAIGPAGFLHCVIGGHGTKFRYLRSARSDDTSRWEDRTDSFNGLQGTYPSLVCDRNGILHLVIRQSGDPDRLSYVRGIAKTTGSKVEWAVQELATIPPLTDCYVNFRHTLRIDRLGRLFVSFTLVRKDVSSDLAWVLMSDDTGLNWRICMTEDFKDDFHSSDCWLQPVQTVLM